MIDALKISSKIYGVVGFRQPFNPDYAIIDPDNQASRSGLFVTDNEFCKVEYLKDSQDYNDISDADFNTYLANKQKESIVSVCNQVFNKADFRERAVFYRNAMNKIDLSSLPTGFVGYRIKPNDDKNLGILLKRVVLDFSGTGSFDLLCFNTGQKAPIYTKTITITTDHQAVDLDWFLDSSGSLYAGEYYIGYINDSLMVTPFQRNYNNSNILTSYKDFAIYPISANHLTADLFDLTIQEGLSDYTGLNFDVTTFDSFTDLVLNNEQLFAHAINLDLQISCLSTYLSSLRSNANERNGDRVALRVLAEIEGQQSDSAQKVTGLRPQLFRAIGTLRNEIEKLQKGYFGDLIMNETLC